MKTTTTKTEVLEDITMAILFNDNMLGHTSDKVLTKMLKVKRAELFALKDRIEKRKRL